MTETQRIQGETNHRCRNLVAAVALLLIVPIGLGAWTSRQSRTFRDHADALKVGMTEAEVVAMIGPPDAAWGTFPAYRTLAYGKGAQFRHSANNLWLDVTGRAQLHAENANWPVQVKLDEQDRVFEIKQRGETTERSIGLKAVGVKRSTFSAPPTP